MNLANFFMIIFATAISMSQLQAQTPKMLKEVNVCLPQIRTEIVLFQIILAKEKAFFEKNGLKVNFIIKPFIDESMYSFYPNSKVDTKAISKINFRSAGVNFFKDEDKCDVINTNIESFLLKPKAMESYQPLQLVAYGDSYDTHLVVDKDSKFKTLKDLKGKKIRVGFTSTVVALEEMLKSEGMSLNDVKLNKTASTELHTALKNKKVDAAISYFPSMHALLASGEVRIIKKDIYKNYLNTPSPQSICFIKKDFSKKNPDIVLAFSKALKEAQDFGNENPSQLAIILKDKSEELGFKKWDISNSTLEKINEIYTNVNAIDFAEQRLNFKGKQLSAIEILENYNQKLIELNYMKNKIDFSPWKRN